MNLCWCVWIYRKRDISCNRIKANLSFSVVLALNSRNNCCNFEFRGLKQPRQPPTSLLHMNVSSVNYTECRAKRQHLPKKVSNFVSWFYGSGSAGYKATNSIFVGIAPWAMKIYKNFATVLFTQPMFSSFGHNWGTNAPNSRQIGLKSMWGQSLPPRIFAK